jgi:hypothetical protein
MDLKVIAEAHEHCTDDECDVRPYVREVERLRAELATEQASHLGSLRTALECWGNEANALVKQVVSLRAQLMEWECKGKPCCNAYERWSELHGAASALVALIDRQMHDKYDHEATVLDSDVELEHLRAALHRGNL